MEKVRLSLVVRPNIVCSVSIIKMHSVEMEDHSFHIIQLFQPSGSGPLPHKTCKSYITMFLKGSRMDKANIGSNKEQSKPMELLIGTHFNRAKQERCENTLRLY